MGTECIIICHCVSVCVCVRARAHVCACVCVRTHMYFVIVFFLLVHDRLMLPQYIISDWRGKSQPLRKVVGYLLYMIQ